LFLSFFHAEDMYEDFIQPVVTANFPEFVVRLFQPGSISGDFLERIVDVEHVIADLSDLSPSADFQLGLRHSYGKPMVFIADEQYVMPLDTSDFKCVRYRYDSSLSEDAQALTNLLSRQCEAMLVATIIRLLPLQKRSSSRAAPARMSAPISRAAPQIDSRNFVPWARLQRRCTRAATHES
jgi:hypothetical protein